jgi:lantibiotic transport system permease protein
MNFIYSFQSEWLKTKRSAASWLCLAGGFMIPFMMMIGYLVKGYCINFNGSEIWQKHFDDSWVAMEGFLLPMGLILVCSLVTQIEFRNNTWKQLHTTPQSFTTIYFSKFSVMLAMTLKIFIFMNVGVILTGILPCLLFSGKMPVDGIPVSYFLEKNADFFFTCLPILAFQYLVSLQFKNFLVPIMSGIVLYVGTFIALQWDYVFLSPFSGCIFSLAGEIAHIPLPKNYYPVTTAVFILLLAANYVLYLRKREKG